jgi:S-(hydroxymethyl)glutathione dehydrogenase/alcohol dehydrogenase
MDIGPGVRKVKPGDLVVMHWLKGSGIDAVTPLYAHGDRRVNAGWITTFNEFAVVSENRITPVAAETDLSAACLLGCAVTTGVGVVLNELNLKPGQSVAVFGCGGVGLNTIQGAVLAGCDPIIAVDPSAVNRAMAIQFGATHEVDPTALDATLEVRRFTGGRGAEAVVVATNNTSGVETAVEASSLPGIVILVGVPSSTKIQVDPFAIHCRRTLTGSYGGGAVPDRDIPAYLGLYKQGRLRLKELISLEVTLDRINEGILAMREGKPGRCVVRMVM